MSVNSTFHAHLRGHHIILGVKNPSFRAPTFFFFLLNQLSVKQNFLRRSLQSPVTSWPAHWCVRKSKCLTCGNERVCFPQRPQCLQATSMATMCGNTAAALPGMRYQVCGGACYLAKEPHRICLSLFLPLSLSRTLSYAHTNTQARTHFILGSAFIIMTLP